MLVGWHYLPNGEDDPFAPLPASTFLDLAPTMGIRSPERLCRIFFKGKPQPQEIAQKAKAWHQQGCRVVVGNEPNLPQEGFGGGPDDYADWFAMVGLFAPGVRLYWAGMSPGVLGWEEWYRPVRAAPATGLVVHAYGTLDQMRATVERVAEIYPTKPLWLAEVNFGAGQQVDKARWADEHFRPFLDWCSTVPQIEAVSYFAYKWVDPDTPTPTSVDGAGTRIETVLRGWATSHVEAGVGGDPGHVESSGHDASDDSGAVRPPPVRITPGGTPMRLRAYLHQFDQLGEQSVAEIAATLRLGGVTEVACKTHQELTWLGNATGGDSSPLAFRSLADVRQRFEDFKAEGIRLVPWCVPMGTNLEQEAQRAYEVAESCEGVIELDVEPYAGFWEGSYAGLEPYAAAITAAGAEYEINFDARDGGWHPFGIDLFSRVCAGAVAVSTQSYYGTAGFDVAGITVVSAALGVLDQIEVPVDRRRIILPSFGHEQYARVAAFLAERGVSRLGMWRMGDAGPAVYAALAAIKSTPAEPEPPAFDVEAERAALWDIKEKLAANGWPRFAQAVEAAVTLSKGER
jgi:hypothetical protein